MSWPILCFFLVYFCSTEGSNTSFSFNTANAGAGFIKFKPLTFPDHGITRLQFCFKTISSFAILLYQEDGRDKYIFLQLKRGKINLDVRGHEYCRVVTTEKAKSTALNDSRWHVVHIEIETKNSTRISLKIDDYLVATVERNTRDDDVCKGFKLPRNNSETGEDLYLYMAGSENIDNPAYASIKYLAEDIRYRFIGCISNLEYTMQGAEELQPAEAVSVNGSSGSCTEKDLVPKICCRGDWCEYKDINSIGHPHVNVSAQPSTEGPLHKWDRENTYSVAPASLASFGPRADILLTTIHVFFVTWFSTVFTRNQ